MVPWLKGLAFGFGAGTLTMGVVSIVAQREERAPEQASSPVNDDATRQSRTSAIARVHGLATEEGALIPSPAFAEASLSDEALAPEPAQRGRAEELKAVHAVRAALLANDPRSALAQLDRYELAFPTASFGLPAQLLRVQALAMSGRPQAAKELAAGFVAAHPDSPHAARLRAFVAGGQ